MGAASSRRMGRKRDVLQLPGALRHPRQSAVVRGAFRGRHTKKDGLRCHGAGAASLPWLGPGGPSCHCLPGAGQEGDRHGKNSSIPRCPGRGRGCRAALRCQQLFPAPCRPEIGWIFLITSLLVSDFPPCRAHPAAPSAPVSSAGHRDVSSRSDGEDAVRQREEGVQGQGCASKPPSHGALPTF